MTAALVTLASLVLALGCQRSQDDATEAVVERVIASKGRESQVEIDRQHGEIRVTLGGAIKPKGWPESVPVYPHADRAKKSEDAAGKARLSISTDDSIAELRSFYRDALAQGGWSFADGEEKSSSWKARRGDEDLHIDFVKREHGRGSRAEIEYGKRS